MFKIFMISPSFYPAFYYGGPIYCTYDLAKALKREKVDIKVITTNANGTDKLKVKTGVYHTLEDELAVKYYHSLDSKGTSFSLTISLFKIIKEADIVHLISVFSPTTPLTLFLCKLFNKPLIISPHGQLAQWCLNQGSMFKKLWLNFFIQPFIKNIVWHLTAETERKDVINIYPEANTFVVANGIDFSPYIGIDFNKNKLFYSKYFDKITHNSVVIISMGRLHRVKGFDILIDAFKIIKSKYENSFLLIAGNDFGEKDNLKKQISQSGLNNLVYLTGHIEGKEKIEFLKNADIFGLPSHDENYGMVYGEALAAGTPVIASKNTPWQDVEKYNCGKWVENTQETFADAIIQVLSSDPVQMGKNGRKYVKDNFSWNRISKVFKEQIEKNLNEKV